MTRKAHAFWECVLLNICIWNFIGVLMVIGIEVHFNYTYYGTQFEINKALADAERERRELEWALR